MRIKRTALLAAASVALAGTAWLSPAHAEDRSNDTVAPNVSPENDVSGRNTATRQNVNHRDSSFDINGVRSLLANATNAAVRENAFGDFYNYFDNTNAHTRGVDTDRGDKTADERNANRDDEKDLNARIAQFRRDWHDKYNQDFNLGNEKLVYADITDSAVLPESRTASGDLRPDDNAPGAADRNRPQADPNANKEKHDPADYSSQKQTPGRSLANQASDLAARGDVMDLNVPAVGHAPSVTVPVVRESQKDYRFYRPSTFDRNQLRQNLASHIQAIDDHKDRWPDDVNQAYRVVSQHILMAIADTEGTTARPAGAELHGTSSLPSNSGTIDSSPNNPRNEPTGINK